MKKSVVKFLSGALLAAGTVFTVQAAEPQVLFSDNFAGKLTWGKSMGLAEVTTAEGPTAGSKALKLVFKTGKGIAAYPQSQHYMSKDAFEVKSTIIVEFDLKVDRSKGNIPMSLKGVAFKDFRSTAIPFVDDDQWEKVKVEITPTTPGVKLDRLTFVADTRKLAPDQETTYYIANLKIYYK